MNVKQYWFWLTNIPGLGNRRLKNLLLYFQKPENIFIASKEEIQKVPGIGDTLADNVVKERNKKKIINRYNLLEQEGIYFVSIIDSEYPERLKNLPDAPYALYYKGLLPDENRKSIAIVGARECSDYGREMAGWFARELARAGIAVISGLARGIDSYAHNGAIRGNGTTYAVLGSGINVCYPPENKWLYEKICGSGGVLSEYRPGIKTCAVNFPMRNRIISGLSDGILVVEAKQKSGALITADMGLEQGKDIFAVPGRIGDVVSYGCNQLIKMGAFMVQHPLDILENYHFCLQNRKEQIKKSNKLLETKEKIVYANLSYYPKHVNEIIQLTEMNFFELLETLSALERKGYIKQTVKNFYILANE